MKRLRDWMLRPIHEHLETMKTWLLGRLETLPDELRRAVPKPPLPDPFVVVLVEAKIEQYPHRHTNLGYLGTLPVPAEKGPLAPPVYEPTTMGEAVSLKSRRQVLKLHSQRELFDVRVTVLCDLERVSVKGIYCGTDPVFCALGSCPVAYFPKLMVGMDLVIDFERWDL